MGAGKARAIGLTGFCENDRLILIDKIGKAGKRADRRLVGHIGEDIVAADRLLICADAIDAPDGAVRPGVGEIDLQVSDRTVLDPDRSEEHTSDLQSLMRISYAVFCLKNKKRQHI